MKKRWKRLYQASAQFICPYCLKHFPIQTATLEHEPPLSRQRELGPSKLFLACKKCNNEKGALTADEYEVWKHTKDFQVWARLEGIRNGNTRGM